MPWHFSAADSLVSNERGEDSAEVANNATSERAGEFMLKELIDRVGPGDDSD